MKRPMVEVPPALLVDIIGELNSAAQMYMGADMGIEMPPEFLEAMIDWLGDDPGDDDPEHWEKLMAGISAVLSTKPPLDLPDVSEYQVYEVYVDAGRANDLFREFCKSLGDAIETSWKDTYEK